MALLCNTSNVSRGTTKLDGHREQKRKNHRLSLLKKLKKNGVKYPKANIPSLVLTSSIPCINGSCNNNNCRCNRQNHFTQAPSGAISSMDDKIPAPIPDQGQLSPKKMLRVRNLKIRFAETISRAHQKMLPLTNGENGDSIMMEHKKVWETELAVQIKIENKIQREKEREAARIKINQMKNTVEFNDPMAIIRDFEMLIGHYH